MKLILIAALAAAGTAHARDLSPAGTRPEHTGGSVCARLLHRQVTGSSQTRDDATPRDYATPHDALHSVPFSRSRRARRRSRLKKTNHPGGQSGLFVMQLPSRGSSR